MCSYVTQFPTHKTLSQRIFVGPMLVSNLIYYLRQYFPLHLLVILDNTTKKVFLCTKKNIYNLFYQFVLS